MEFGIVLQIFILSVALPIIFNSPAGDGFAGQSSLGAAPVNCLSVETLHKIILVDFLSADTF